MRAERQDYWHRRTDDDTDCDSSNSVKGNGSLRMLQVSEQGLASRNLRNLPKEDCKYPPEEGSLTLNA